MSERLKSCPKCTAPRVSDPMIPLAYRTVSSNLFVNALLSAPGGLQVTRRPTFFNWLGLVAQMIRMFLKNSERPVHLLQQDHPRQLMRQRHPSQRQRQPRLPSRRFGKPVAPSDRE